jgi:hypothetical protein
VQLTMRCGAGRAATPVEVRIPGEGERRGRHDWLVMVLFVVENGLSMRFSRRYGLFVFRLST